MEASVNDGYEEFKFKLGRDRLLLGTIAGPAIGFAITALSDTLVFRPLNEGNLQKATEIAALMINDKHTEARMTDLWKALGSPAAASQEVFMDVPSNFSEPLTFAKIGDLMKSIDGENIAVIKGIWPDMDFRGASIEWAPIREFLISESVAIISNDERCRPRLLYKLWKLMGSPTVSPEAKSRIEKSRDLIFASSQAFNARFKGVGIAKYYKYLCKICSQWKEKKYFSMYHALINASMTGKSRLATAIIQTLLFGFYMNFGEDGCIPSPIPLLKDFVDNSIRKVTPHQAELRVYSFMITCVTELLDWLKQKPQDSSQSSLFLEWYQLQAEDPQGFWKKILTREKLVYAAFRLKTLKEAYYLQVLGPTALKDLIAKALEKGELIPLKEVEEIHDQLPEELKEGSEKWLQSVMTVYWNQYRSILKSIHDLLWGDKTSENYVNMRKAFKSEDEDGCPDVLFIFDEARGLLNKEKKDDEIKQAPFIHFRRAGKYEEPESNPLAILVFTDTWGKVANFCPAGDIPASTKVIGRTGGSLFEPYWSPHSIDVHVNYPDVNSNSTPHSQLGSKTVPSTTRAVLSANEYAIYGRAGLKAMVEKMSELSFLSFLEVKIQKNIFGPDTDISKLAVLGFLISLQVNPKSEICQELVASHMHLSGGFSNDRHFIYTLPVPEPLLGYAARSAIHDKSRWASVLEALNKHRDALDVNVGIHGETAGQILRSMAHFHAEAKLKGALNHELFQRDRLPILPVPVVLLLQCLGFVGTAFKTEAKKNLFKKCLDRLQNCYTRVVQTTRSYSDPSPAHLSGRFARANAIMCRNNYTGVDGFFPMLVDPNQNSSFGPEFLNEINGNSKEIGQGKLPQSPRRPISLSGSRNAQETILSVIDASLENDNMSFIGFQDKLYTSKTSYKKWATKDMERRRVTGVFANDLNQKLPYLSIVMDHGPSLTGKPEYSIFESSDNQQISLAVRGLRPVDVLPPGTTDLPVITAEFERLIESDRCPPAGSSLDYVIYLLSTDNSSDLFMFTPESQAERLLSMKDEILNPTSLLLDSLSLTDQPQLKDAMADFIKCIDAVKENLENANVAKKANKYVPMSPFKVQAAFNAMHELRMTMIFLQNIKEHTDDSDELARADKRLGEPIAKRPAKARREEPGSDTIEEKILHSQPKKKPKKK